MLRLGLALSGGGFRATLYHLGVVRYLRDADLLSSVTHMTSVSGGSVLAAHLVLNWDRYNGTAEEFDEAAGEIVDFVRLDIRNRIIRRYPFALACSFGQRVAQQRPWRGFTRTGLLESHYRRHLFGDTCLFQMPTRPELHILSTNLSEGGLSSFTREGLLFEDRSTSAGFSMTRHRTGLATVPMAVAASSAFPGFFPPLELAAADVGAVEGDFQTQYFTDGGVYDNLGVRMFRYLERQQRSAVLQDDFANVEAAVGAWNHAAKSDEASPLRRIAEIFATAVDCQTNDGAGSPQVTGSDDLLGGLEKVIAETNLAEDPQLKTLLGRDRHNGNGNGNGNGHSNGNGHGPIWEQLQSKDRLARNRQLLSEAFDDAIGDNCLRSTGQGFDAVIASDAGKKFQATRPDRAGSFLRTALRSSDILMDRVWQLEREHFAESTGYVVTPITRIVTAEDDPTALHPEVQVQVSRVRTDMDRFQDEEVSGLVRHGYCVARRAVAERACLATHSHEGEPWDPIASAQHRKSTESLTKSYRGARASSDAAEARKLQQSSRRRYFSLILSPKDGFSYLYLPICIALFAILPYFGYKEYRHARVTSTLTSAIAGTRHDYRQLLQMMEFGTVEPFRGFEFVDVNRLDPLLGEQGLDIISDTRITDLRKLQFESRGVRTSAPYIYFYRLVSIRKTAEADGDAGLCMQSLWDMPNITARCLNSELDPVLRRCPVATGEQMGGEDSERYAWQFKLDFREVPIGHTTDVVVEAIIPCDPTRRPSKTREWWQFEVDANPEVATSWILLPEQWHHADAELVRFENANLSGQQLVEPTYEAMVNDGSLLNWTVLHPKAGFTYASRWNRGD